MISDSVRVAVGGFFFLLCSVKFNNAKHDLVAGSVRCVFIVLMTSTGRLTLPANRRKGYHNSGAIYFSGSLEPLSALLIRIAWQRSLMTWETVYENVLLALLRTSHCWNERYPKDPKQSRKFSMEGNQIFSHTHGHVHAYTHTLAKTHKHTDVPYRRLTDAEVWCVDRAIFRADEKAFILNLTLDSEKKSKALALSKSHRCSHYTHNVTYTLHSMNGIHYLFLRTS